MFGVHIPEYTTEKYLLFMVHNADKNYLTPLELAALADNHLLDITIDSLTELLDKFGQYTDNETSQAAIAVAVKLANFAREN